MHVSLSLSNIFCIFFLSLFCLAANQTADPPRHPRQPMRESSFHRHVSSSPSTSHGLFHTSVTSYVVGICVQLKIGSVLCSLVPQRGHSGDLYSVGFILCFQARRHGDLPVRSWANVALVLLGSVFRFVYFWCLIV